MKLNLIVKDELEERLNRFVTREEFMAEAEKIKTMIEFISKDKQIRKKSEEIVLVRQTAEDKEKELSSNNKNILKEWGFDENDI